jgi:2-C-methyl-D-erythritol 4-phosphate cytidylyltransferase
VTVGAVVPAAGRGERLGPGEPKALREIGGAPLLVLAVSALLSSSTVRHVVVAAPPDSVAQTRALLAPLLGGRGADVEVVPGGDTRTDSVALALAALPPDVDVVLVHDAARPLVPVAVIDRVVAAVRAGAEAVVPAVPIPDTVRQVDLTGRVEATLDRDALRAVQTPQGFMRATLAKAYAEDPEPSTDDAGLVERLGIPVVVVPGHEEAFKVTRPLDLQLAETVIARRRARGEHL